MKNFKKYIAGFFVLTLVVWVFIYPKTTYAAISLIGHGQGFSTSTNGFTSGSMDTTGANFIAVCLAEGGGVNNGVLTDSKSNTWTKKTQQLTNGKSNEIWYAFNATVGTGHTFSVSGSANFPAINVAWFNLVQSGSDPFDVENGGNQIFSSTVQTGNVTPSVANELIITCLEGDGNAGASTIDSSFTVVDDITDTTFGHQKSTEAYQIQTTATSRNPTWTFPTASSIAAPIATFKASAGTPAVINKPKVVMMTKTIIMSKTTL